MLSPKKGAERMNESNLYWLVCASVHSAWAVFYLFLTVGMYCLEATGPVAWAVPAACLGLLVLDLTGKLSLKNGAILAGLTLPLLCSCGDMLLWGDQAMYSRTPSVHACVFSLLLLAVYTLLRRERGEPLDRAEKLLLQGDGLGGVWALWLVGIAGSILVMATAGLLITLFIGMIIASRNDLLDYDGIKGFLAGLLVLYGLRAVWYGRAVRLIEGAAPEVDTGRLRLARFFPLWAERQSQALFLRLQLWRIDQAGLPGKETT